MKIPTSLIGTIADEIDSEPRFGAKEKSKPRKEKQSDKKKSEKEKKSEKKKPEKEKKSEKTKKQ